MRLGVSTYSFWHFKGPKEKLESYIRRAYEHGFEGVEILVDHFESTRKDYLAEIKKLAFSLGLDIYAVAIHNDFVSPDPREREKQIRYTERWLEIAHYLGAKAIRVNSGRWRTIASFDELMEARGLEPPLPGYNYEDAFKWVIECIEQVLPLAEDCGVVLALENHWGLTRDAEGVLRILKEVDSPWLRALMDVGNFIENTYEQLEMITPYTIMVHAKTYYGGGEWYTLDIDYDRIFDMLKRYEFKGWISLEYEGKEDYDSGVKKSFELLSRYVKL